MKIFSCEMEKFRDRFGKLLLISPLFATSEKRKTKALKFRNKSV
ncbi:hypothetical protein C723_2444 [Christiangramia flava JLT2011]|uniref:Uncharacterized protein n=1 Tax=Christiangramia flava JLT2011 TaxID=1229726 RepID=A0A1L7I1K1_9FLAO|nr:hypothetical protein GRFL_0329 [Christiangramia flava JLT2011]OSS38726.1 hypothetical protein C723_2444 [Christiangramia flava JLT2011]